MSSVVTVFTPWLRKCHKVSDSLGVEMMIHDESEDQVCAENDQFQDDGSLHIQKRGEYRVSFDIGQDTPSKEANDLTRNIMTALGLEKKISGRVLVKPDQEERGYCSECGRGYV